MDYQEGIAIQETIKQQNIPFLTYLLGRKPSVKKLHGAILASVMLGKKPRLQVSRMLLDVGTRGPGLNVAITKAVKKNITNCQG